MKIENLAKPMATAEGQARNEEVFRAAAELMTQKGFGGTSIGDIAKAVGMTKAGLYHHISSKQDMLYQILNYGMDLADSLVVKPTRDIADPEQRLREIVRRYARGLIESGTAFALLVSERKWLEPLEGEEFERRVKGFRKYVMGTLEELDAKDRLYPQDIRITTMHILRTIIGIAGWYSPQFPADGDQIVEETVSFALRAVLKPE
ncbi:MAG: TetR/AcrR family transcriptional regulator [Opitutaceae bacterium]|nr:TetR/AcrR family transcriptional regulator [Opitutaceae bacterium]